MNEYLKTINSETTSTAERIGLPTGFVTEKGSAYRYNPDGSIHRDKFDGTESDAGIAVFIEDTPDNLDVLTRLGTQQKHLPVERQKKGYVLQILEGKNGEPVAEKVFKAADVKDPSRLAFALINPLDQVLGWVPASMKPQLGSYVYEMDKLPDGTTVRHPGHRVSDIIK
jgi:hypothetical protein